MPTRMPPREPSLAVDGLPSSIKGAVTAAMEDAMEYALNSAHNRMQRQVRDDAINWRRYVLERTIQTALEKRSKHDQEAGP